MTDRKFTPPTEFPAEYVDGRGKKAVILGRGLDKQFPFIGYDAYGGVISWTEHGEVYPKQTNPYDLHDIPKRITTWHNVYANWMDGDFLTRSAADRSDQEVRTMKRLCVYRIERDEGSGNPEIFVEET